jgi:hypothetical protein
MTDLENIMKDDIKMLVDLAYDRGINIACDGIITALEQIHSDTLSIDHIKKLVKIVQRISTEKK